MKKILSTSIVLCLVLLSFNSYAQTPSKKGIKKQLLSLEYTMKSHTNSCVFHYDATNRLTGMDWVLKKKRISEPITYNSDGTISRLGKVFFRY